MFLKLGHSLRSTPQILLMLKEGLLQSNARFKVLMNSVPITDMSRMLSFALDEDRWQGFPEQREEILSFIEDEQIEGLVWLTGDLHYGQLGHVDPPGGTAENQWELLVGPAGSTLNSFVELVLGGPNADRARAEVVVEDHGVDAALRDARQPRLRIADMLDRITLAREDALHEPPQRRVVVDIENRQGPMGHGLIMRGRHGVSGTCMTEKNSPSWRIALAKPS